MLTLHSNLSDTELDNKIKELEDDKISLNLTYLATHNLNGDRKYERSIPAIDSLSLASSIKLEDLDEDLQDYYKEFFKASNKKIKDELKESKEEDILKARSIIADQIRGEWDADKGYTKAAADLAELKDIDTKEAQDMMLDIASEEHVHVGELETAYDAFDPKLFDELEDGHNEADEKAEPANALDYDITEEPVANDLDIKDEPVEEALIESVESDQIEKINDFLNRLYELRNKSIKADGEFGIGNLVFKELRNKGYLDNLKELKHQLKSKDLSLE